jgi:hypothetical protein
MLLAFPFYAARTLSLVFGLSLFAVFSASAQFYPGQFKDFTTRVGIDNTPELSWGSAWGDVNGDGYPDLFVGNHYQIVVKNSKPPVLYLSNPTGVFSTDSVPNFRNVSDMHGAGWLDFDNDGDKDLVVTTGRANRNGFWVNQGGGVLVEQAVALGADFPLCRGRTPLFLDQNRDGLLDLIMTAGPIVLPTQLPTSLALAEPSCTPACFSVVSSSDAGFFSDQASTQALLVDPDGDDLLHAMIITQRDQIWAQTGCVPIQEKGRIIQPLTIEALGGDFNGDMLQDLFFVRNRSDQSYVDNPFPMNYFRVYGQDSTTSYNLLEFPLNGVLSLRPGDELRYTPNPGFTGLDSITVEACDAEGICLIFPVRYAVGVSPPAGRDFKTVVPDSFLQFSLRKLAQPFEHRLRANLVAEGDIKLFTVRNNADSLLVIFDEGAVPPSQVFIGAGGYNPVSTNQILLKAADVINHGIPSPPGSPAQSVLISYNPISDTWSFGINSNSGKFSLTASLFSSRPMLLLQTLNFDTVPVTVPNALLIRQEGSYLDVTAAAGLNFNTEAFGATIGDFDNDMDLDIYLSCGIIGRNVANILLENDGTGRFTQVPLAAGADGSRVGSAGSVNRADYNRDGFLDIFVDNGRDPEKKGPYQLFHNMGNDNSWIGITLQGTQSNRDGIGAVVRAYAGGKGQIRFADGGFHRYVQDDDAIHFGMGPNKVVDSITVRWPSGARSVLTDVLCNQYITITEPLSPTWSCFPPKVAAVTTESSGFRLRWNPVDCASQYRLTVQPISSGPANVANISDTAFLVPNSLLTPGLDYEWLVQARCSNGEFGALARGELFQLSAAALDGATAFRLAPNPAQNRVQIMGLQGNASYRIVDLTGREVQMGQVEPGQEIPLVGFSPGIYRLSWLNEGSDTPESLPLQIF